MEEIERLGGEDTGRPTSRRAVVFASVVGTVIEWYDFFLYATAAALVFSQLFFPTFDPLAGTMAAFATYAVGFLFRPIGGIFFGHFGDRIGRKSMLVTTLLLMGISSALIGLLPSYESIGVWAAIVLVALRCLQGFAAGGEWGGAMLMTTEYAPRDRRGLFGGFVAMGVALGLLLSNIAFITVSLLPEEQFFSWGWRVPFLFSLILVGVGLFIRLRIMETPLFARVRETNTEARMPIIDVIRNHPKNLLLAMGMFIGVNAGLYIVYTFMLTYGTAIGVSRGVMLTGVLIASVVEVFGDPGFGALSDRLGRKTVYLAGAIFTALWVFPMFWLVDTGIPVLIYLALAVALIGLSAQYGTTGAFFAELFSTRLRYSGASLGYQAASVLGGGFAPLIGTALLAWSGGEGWPIATYMFALFILTIVSVLLTTETFQKDISEERPGESASGTGSEVGA
jgi:MFS transporter, MHS family, shikimate and dehydroshikimate transport protein